MPDKSQPVFLIASHDPDLLRAAETALRASGARVEIAFDAESALERFATPAPLSPVLDVALLDPRLPGMPFAQLLGCNEVVERSLADRKHLCCLAPTDKKPVFWSNRRSPGRFANCWVRGLHIGVASDGTFFA